MRIRDAILLLLLALACTTERAPRPNSIDSTLPIDTGGQWTGDSISPDSSALEELLDSLAPGASVDTVIRDQPALDTSTVILPETTTVITPTTRPDTTIVVRADPRGIAFGLFGLLGTAPASARGAFTLAHDSYSPSNIVSRIAAARASGLRIHLAIMGGNHANYLTDFGDGKGPRFDLDKWLAKLEGYDTPAIRKAIAQGVKDGTIIGTIVMDEPHVSGKGDGNTWGPPGTMTKLIVDGLCAAVKAKFATLAVGVAHQPEAFEPTKHYTKCEYLLAQYSDRSGALVPWRTATLAGVKRDGMAVLFSMNLMNGGFQAKRTPGDTTWTPMDCPLTGPKATGGNGTYYPNCAMTPAQIRTVGKALGPAGCGLLAWRFDERFMAKPENAAALAEVTAFLATKPNRSCRRPA